MEKKHNPPPQCLMIPSPAQHTRQLIQQVISAILYKFDPSEINFNGENYGEYTYEAKLVWDRMFNCKNAEELKIVIDDVFTHSFSSNWGQFISPVQKSVHLGLMARQIWTVKEILLP